MTEYDCPACPPDDREWCDHEPGEEPLGRALADFFGCDAEHPGVLAQFMNDAGCLLRDAGPGPYTFTWLEKGWHNEHAFVLNNLIVTIGEGGKDCPAEPEVAAKLPDGVVIDVQDRRLVDGSA